jgi:hypothetical protein
MKAAFALVFPVVASVLAACSMSTEYLVRKNLLAAGFSPAEARCAVDGVSAHLSNDQLWALRGPVMDFVFEKREERMDIDQWLGWIAPQVAPEVHHVLAHYAAHCRATRPGA